MRCCYNIAFRARFRLHRGNSLGSTQTDVPGLRAVLRLPRNRVFCRGGVRRRVQMVEKGVQTATPAGFRAPGRALQEVNAPHFKPTGRRAYLPDDPKPPAPREESARSPSNHSTAW